MTDTFCIYHAADLDGLCSGAIMRSRFPGATLLPMDYGDSVPWSLFEKARAKGPIEVFMADFSLQPWGDMRRLACLAENFTWVDHHVTARENYERDPVPAVVRYDPNRAACEILWDLLMDSPVPPAVKLLGRYDVWDHSDPMTLPFQMGMRLHDFDPRLDTAWGMWLELFEADDQSSQVLANVVRRGDTILVYQKQQNVGIMGKAFEVHWEGLNFLAVNAGGINSTAFESRYDPDAHDAVMAFHFDGVSDMWSFSLYSPDQRFKDDSTLSDIAKRRGGGGHNCACGFKEDHLPPDLKI